MDLGPGLNNYINNYFIFCWFKEMLCPYDDKMKNIRNMSS